MTVHALDAVLSPSNLHGLSTPLDIAVTISARLVRSTEPAVVLTSLALSCVPIFSDGCSIEVIENGTSGYHIAGPSLPTSKPEGPTTNHSGGRIMTIFDGTPHGEAPSYRGVITHTWRNRPATLIDVAIARILADRAVAGISQEKLADLRDQANDAVANLQLALASDRQTGIAIGVLMSAHRISEDTAFDRLTTAAAQSNRTLRDVATEVVRAGRLEDSRAPRG